MIQTRSPFYYNAVFPNAFITSVDFTVNIGTGNTTTITIEQTYSLTKPNPSTASTNTWVDLSPYIRDSYTYAPMSFTGVAANEVRASGAHSVLMASVTASFNDTIGSAAADTSQKYICSDGYNYYTDGQNVQPTKKILLAHTEYKADYRGYFIVPLRCESGDADPTVNASAVTLGYTNTNTNYIKYLVIPCANYTGVITVAFEGEAITIELVSECKFDVNEIQFLNRYGAFEVLHFYKAKKETLSIKTDTFKNAYTNGVSYDVARHQEKTYNVRANKSITIETGFLNEEYNDTLQELLQSEFVWMDGKPVNLKSSSLEFKTRAVDKLISYSINFDYAYDQMSNV